MNIPSVAAAIFGSGAKIVSTASSLAVVMGAVYLVDCRISAKGTDAIDRCYLSALPMMGLGAGVGGGYLAGYNTYNPALKGKEEGGLLRDERGRYTKQDKGP